MCVCVYGDYTCVAGVCVKDVCACVYREGVCLMFACMNVWRRYVCAYGKSECVCV